MKRLKGPELKMPNVKVPPFLENLYWDLRDRRLLPLVALVLVAIVAAPFLLAGDTKEEPAGSEGSAASVSSGPEGADALVVVEEKPGLRDYRKRLAGRTPTDPFQQHVAKAAHKGNGAQLPDLPSEASSSGTTVTGGGGESSSSGGAAPASPSPAPDESSSGGSAKGGGGDATNGGGDSGKLTIYTFAIDVRITRSGGKDAESKKASKESEPGVKHRVLPQTPLPGEKEPVVTYMGASRKGKALLLVSTDVKAVFGETKCVTGDDACQLIEAEPGFPVTFVFGYNEVHYTISVLKIEPVRVGST
jgi:hypothetical protein